MPVFQASGYRVNGPVNSETVIDGIAICLRLFIPDFRLLEANQKAYLQKLDVLTELIDNRFHPSNVGRFRDWGY
jgi:hypothetical protein